VKGRVWIFYYYYYYLNLFKLKILVLGVAAKVNPLNFLKIIN
jgi:hypothetical protein